MLKEFREFALKGNVVDMAVGIIIGAAFTTIVKSLVNDLLMPPLGILFGGVDFTEYYINLSGGTADSLAAARDAGMAVIAYGLFINAVIQFLIVAFALFLVVRWINVMRRRFEEPAEAAAPAAPPRQEVLLEEIRDLLRARGA